MNALIRELSAAVGKSAKSLPQWKVRGGVPHRYRLDVLELAADLGETPAKEDLEWLRPEGTRRAERTKRRKKVAHRRRENP